MVRINKVPIVRFNKVIAFILVILSMMAFFSTAQAVVLQASKTTIQASVSQNPVFDGYLEKTGTGDIVDFTNQALVTDYVLWTQHGASQIRFDLSSINTAGFASVKSATLTLNAYSVSNPGNEPTYVWRIHPSNTNLDPSKYNFTYNNTQTLSPWQPGDGGGNYMFEVSYEGNATQQVITTTGNVQFDVTNMVNDWLFNNKANNGFLVRTGPPHWGLPGDGNAYDIRFRSSEYSTDYSVTPKLDIVLNPIFDGYLEKTGSGDVVDFTNQALVTDYVLWTQHGADQIRFDLSGINTTGVNQRVWRATLTLNAYSVSNPGNEPTYVWRINPSNTNLDPSKYDYTYNNTQTLAYWQPGVSGNYMFPVAYEGDSTQQVITATGEVKFDVTRMVDEWLFEGKPNYGFLVRTGPPHWGLPGDGTAYDIRFRSSEYSTDYSVTPKLEIILDTFDGYLEKTGGGDVVDFTTQTLVTDYVPWSQHGATQIRFDLNNSVNESLGSRVQSATLTLNAYYVSNAGSEPTYVWRIHPSNTNLDPSKYNFTYNNAQTLAYWQPGDGLGNYMFPVAYEGNSAQQVITTSGNVQFDVRDIVNDWLFNNKANDGFLVRTGTAHWGLPGGGTAYDIKFRSSEYSNQNIIPKLSITLHEKPHYRVWYHPYYAETNPEYYSYANINSGLDTMGKDRWWSNKMGVTGLKWASGPTATGGTTSDWYKQQVNPNVGNYVYPGASVDEWNNPDPGKAAACAQGLRDARVAWPNNFVQCFVTGPDSTFTGLVSDGTINLAIIEGYQYIPGGGGVGLPTIRERCNVMANAGLLNKTIVCFGYITDGLSQSALYQYVSTIHDEYPAMPGIGFYGYDYDTAATRSLIQYANNLSWQYYSPYVRFIDGFESGSFTQGGWTNSGTTFTTSYVADGAKATQFNNTDSITKAISTANYESIHLEYKRMVRNFDASGDNFYAEWYDGSVWNELEHLTANSSWASKDYLLPSSANNNPNFKIRFRTSCGSLDYAHVDLVRVTGIPQ